MNPPIHIENLPIANLIPSFVWSTPEFAMELAKARAYHENRAKGRLLSPAVAMPNEDALRLEAGIDAMKAVADRLEKQSSALYELACTIEEMREGLS